MACFKEETDVVVLLKARWVERGGKRKKKNHCNDATEGTRGSLQSWRSKINFHYMLFT